MSKNVALIGAAGKMGTRVFNNLRRYSRRYRLLLSEKTPEGIEEIHRRGLEPMQGDEAVAHADMTILAVPDAAIRAVSAELVPHAAPGSVVLLLDPAAAASGEMTLRDDVTFVVCHPCHPPLFGSQESQEAREDFFGGVAAVQDIVIALHQGDEKHYAPSERLCRDMFSPVANAHRITVEQMAILEPAMAEVVAASAAVLMREALEEAIKAGVPREAATSFMLGHAQIPLAIAFGAIGSPFSDAAKIAIRYGQENIYKSDWRKVFEPERIQECIHRMLHPEQE
jgi:D-apionate oxidoisomerase